MSAPIPIPIAIAEADRLGWPTLSVAQSRQIDQTAIRDHGVAGIVLMENAGTACGERLRAIASASPSVVILCGGGNNGGDGFVIARHLHRAGGFVRVILLVPRERLHGDAATSHSRAIDEGIEIQTITDAAKLGEAIHCGQLAGDASKLSLIVDCMLGTGATGDPREPYATAIEASNQAQCTRVAIDIPSGLNGDTGVAGDPTFRADLTLTFVTAKIGMRNPDASAYLGEVEIVDIGLPIAMMRSLRGD